MDKKNQLETLEFQNYLMRSILDHIHEGVYVVDADGKIILYNHMIAVSEGTSPESILGKTEEEVYAEEDLPHLQQYTRRVFEEGAPQKNCLLSYQLPNKNYSHLLHDMYPLYDKGKVVCAYSIGRDLYGINEFIAKTLEAQMRLDVKVRNKNSTGADYFLSDIISMSPVMKEAVSQAERSAYRDSSVLLFGETGTGKEMFAQGIHNASVRSHHKFLAVNCAAIPESLLESIFFGTTKGAFTGAIDMPGIFEQAGEGTVFLDEINSMPLGLQTKLLRVLQSKKVRRVGGNKDIAVKCRFISAMSKEPQDALNDSDIGLDFFYRMSVMSIRIPPLRERLDDIPLLVRHYIEGFNGKYNLKIKDVASDFYDNFEGYQWPGNVRELGNIVEACMNWAEAENQYLSIKNLPSYYLFGATSKRIPKKVALVSEAPRESKDTLQDKLTKFEISCIVDALAECGGNITYAAEALGISRQNLHYRLRRHQINATGFHEK